MTDESIYEAAYVRSLFDEMSKTYGLMNLISSFGFASHWRKRCVRGVEILPGSTVVDLMTGMGELCPELARRVGRLGQVQAVDFSPEMCRRARQQIARSACHLEIIEADALCSVLDPCSADAVVSSFGLKTFSRTQIAQLAAQIARVLKPGGCFSLLEISVPPSRWLRGPYMFYIKHVIPWIGRLFLGNPENYRMLGRYTEAFGSCATIRDEWAHVGLVVEQQTYFFGCATGISGYKPKVAGD